MNPSGEEIRCRANWEGDASSGSLFISDDTLYYKGSYDLEIPFEEVESVSMEEGWLRIQFEDGMVSFALGNQAPSIAERIRKGREAASDE